MSGRRRCGHSILLRATVDDTDERIDVRYLLKSDDNGDKP